MTYTIVSKWTFGRNTRVYTDKATFERDLETLKTLLEAESELLSFKVTYKRKEEKE